MEKRFSLCPSQTKVDRVTKKKAEAPPTVYVIAGANGAGKTTFSTKFLPDFVKCREFLNADLIAAGLAPFAPETQNVRAGRLLLERIGELSKERASFGFETTLSGRTYLKILDNMKTGGYRIVLFFLWLPSADLAISRVQNRVREGGHHIPAEVIRRRYSAGLRNFFRSYRPLLDEWWLYDASSVAPKVVAFKKNTHLITKQESRYRQIEKAAGHANEEAD